MNPFAKKLSPVTQEAEVTQAVRHAIGNNTIAESALDVLAPEVLTADEVAKEVADTPDRVEKGKLSRLVSDDFPFDDSQLRAVYGMLAEPYACMTGAAGTGKTTTTKKFVDMLLTESKLDVVNMSTYFKSVDERIGTEEPDKDRPNEVFIPSVALVGFTGRSAQMIKKNFPRDWHGNIMTIHRLLAFTPEYYEDEDVETQQIKMKMRFVPQYNAENKMPWKVIIIDEAGMVGLELWHQLLAAMLPDTRIYMIGDINQLPPVHGRSVFGFAMAKWPSFELTHVHRQQGKNNSIVDNAWRVLQGQMPQSEGRFQMHELPGESAKASAMVLGILPKLKLAGVYVPERDSVITAINGEDGQRGFNLGQRPLNERLALIFNPQTESPRYIIDGGRERKQFAVGDKVMATKNDHDSGITNGMTGIITDIQAHPGYGGDHRRFGTVQEVNEWMASDDYEDDEEFSLEDLNDSFEAQVEAHKDAKEKKDRGPASHEVTVQFGVDEYAFEITFRTLSEVGSLMTAYVCTCHKMQGGESPTIVIICHDAHKAMLYREWLYTAITRASEKCILLFTPLALKTALSKQNIKGKTLKEKIAAFNALQTNNGLGAAVRVLLPDSPNPNLPQDSTANEPSSTALAVLSESGLVPVDDTRPEPVVVAEKSAPSPSPAPETQRPKWTFQKTIVKEIHHHHTIIVERSAKPEAERKTEAPTVTVTQVEEPSPVILDATFEVINTDTNRFSVVMLEDHTKPGETGGLDQYYADESYEYPPLPEKVEPAKPTNPWAKKLGVKG